MEEGGRRKKEEGRKYSKELTRFDHAGVGEISE